MSESAKVDAAALFSKETIESAVSGIVAHANAMATTLVSIKRESLPKQSISNTLLAALVAPQVVDPVVSDLLALSLLEKAIEQLKWQHGVASFEGLVSSLPRS